MIKPLFLRWCSLGPVSTLPGHSSLVVSTLPIDAGYIPKISLIIMYLQNISKYIKISALYLHFRSFIPIHRAVPRFHGKCSISLSPLQCRPKGLGWQMRFTGVEAACASRTFLRVRDGFQWFSEKNGKSLEFVDTRKLCNAKREDVCNSIIIW